MAKYGPTGPMMTKTIAFPARDTPRDGWGRREEGQDEGESACRTITTFNTSGWFIDAKAHLGSDEGGSDVEAGVLGVGNPLFVDLHQLPDALEHFTFIKQLQRRETLAVDSSLFFTHKKESLFCSFKRYIMSFLLVWLLVLVLLLASNKHRETSIHSKLCSSA